MQQHTPLAAAPVNAFFARAFLASAVGRSHVVRFPARRQIPKGPARLGALHGQTRGALTW